MTLALVLVAVVGFFYVRARYRAWRLMRHEAAKLRAQGAAKTRRPVLQRVLSMLPLTLSQNLFRWRSEVRTRPFTAAVALARRGPLGRRERIRLTQHILLAGQTGSGKSSTQRVIAAHVLQAPDACLEVWDLKRISALRDYRGRARTCVTAAEVSARLRDLVGREFTERADQLIAGEDVPYLVVLVDEAATLLRELDAYAERDFFGAVEMGRELRVFFVLAVQHPLALTIPTQLRSQLACVISHRLKSAKESEVVFPGLGSAGWAPHLLGGPGTCLVWEHDRSPRTLYGLWLSPARFRGLRVHGQVTTLGAPVSLDKRVAPVAVARPDTRLTSHDAPATATRNTRTDAFAEEVERALLGGPAGVREIARTTGRNPGSVHRKIRQMAVRGLVEETPDGFTLPHVNAQEEDYS
ncbi:helix-turn-helix domain-containing protein [Streptomyces canus]|uniref:helix-turn-helix domain-containing protein n=1 Tax=Streptomyces canus TaxID=58343 RepID=UPI002E2A1A18|nr:helix-turn-helix domain-containing protein [Streptomyces canus]